MSPKPRDQELERRNQRTALMVGALAAAFVIGFVIRLWLR